MSDWLSALLETLGFVAVAALITFLSVVGFGAAMTPRDDKDDGDGYWR
jgi:hypothetical protein